MREGLQGVALSARSAPVLSPTDRSQKTSEYSEYTHIKKVFFEDRYAPQIKRYLTVIAWPITWS